jgi:predicted thioesterase
MKIYQINVWIGRQINMELCFKEGLDLIKELVVTQKQTASEYGSGSLDVFATPAMISLMEGVSKDIVESYLPKGYTTVGIAVDVKHIKATPVGMKVKCKSTLVKIEGKKLFFDVESWDEREKIGQGSHIRYIVNSMEFMKKIQ